MMDIDDLLIRVSLLFTVGCMCPVLGVSQQKGAIDIRIDINKTYQVISNFGASDAWSCQFVGNWPGPSKNEIADWLFSMDTLANGSPKGIGLSLWRFNIGAGSAGQGAASGIKDEWRRAESFIEKDNQYNWNRQQGQRWFLTAARLRGVQQFLGFFNSPPIPFTVNGKAYASDGKSNIDSNHYGAFAGYSVDVLKGIRQTTGVELNYISPVNEPQWAWSDGGQEGCPYTNIEIGYVVKAFNAALLKNRLTTRILVPESGHHKYLWEDDDKPGKGNQVMAFFNPSSSCYIGNLPNVAKIIASHSYFSSAPFSQAMAVRKKIAQHTEANGLAYWQSEYCILGDNAGEISGGKRDVGMNAALHIARVIYADLVGGNAAAWQWWLAISPYDYKDGLIYIDKNEMGGNYYDSKMLWAFGNYSRFIRPGMKRVYADAPPTDSVLVSAYKDEQAKKLVVVVVNGSTKAQPITVKNPVNKAISANGQWNAYTTSDSKRLEKQVLPAGQVDITPKSVVTLETVYSDL